MPTITEHFFPFVSKKCIVAKWQITLYILAGQKINLLKMSYNQKNCNTITWKKIVYFY